MKVKTSDLIAQFLKDKEITTVFGIIGAGCAHLFDSIDKLGYTEIVSVHHEQAAVMAMGTYYRTSGKLSASIVTTGAGSTNAVTGVVSTWMDSIPGLIISGNEKSIFTRKENDLRIWGVQGYASNEMVEKVTKYSNRVMKAEDTISELNKAIEICLSGRPGPCWIDIPMDIQTTQIDPAHAKVKKSEIPAVLQADDKELDDKVAELVKLIEASKRPLLWLGHGIKLSGADDQILPMLEKYKIPSLVTWNGIDMVDSDHPYVFGRAGVYGQRYSNFILQNSDLVICIGNRMALPQVGYDISEFAREAKVVSVDIDKKELGKYPDRLSIALACDAKRFINKFMEASINTNEDQFSEWLKYCNTTKEKFPVVGPEHADTNGFINSYRFMERLSEDMKDDQHVVTDMGTALLSGHQVLKMKKGQRLMTSTGLGEMGFGLPAAVGVSFARNKGEVLCLNCDGGMMMNLQELQTIIHHKLPVKIIVFNNDGYLMIKNSQKSLFKGHYTCSDKSSGVTCPDFNKLGQAFGFETFSITTWDDYDKNLSVFLNSDGPAICEVFMDPEQPCIPKLGVSVLEDGSLISPPLEDLSPFVSRQDMKESMLIGMHEKSKKIKE